MLRREALRITGLAPLLAMAAVPARAAFVDAPDVVVFCDPPLREPLIRLGALFHARGGAPVRLLCAPARVMAAQLARNVRDDVVITLSEVVQQLADAGIARPQPSVGIWRNRLVFAGKGAGDGHPGAAPASADALLHLLGARMWRVRA